MFTRSTVLVLGAGASMPYDYPSGRRLLELVVSNDSTMRELLHGIGISAERITGFINALYASGRQSIDAFLEGTGGKHDDIGKAAIAALLSQRESAATLFRHGKDKSWYAYLFDELTSRGVERFGENRLRILTFNYDRSLEYFLVTSLQNSFNLEYEKCTALVRQLEIVHLHGTVGCLPGLGLDGAFTREYGPIRDGDELRKSAGCIRIVHQVPDALPEFQRALALLSQAEHIVFLGFGYLSINVERLRLPEAVGNRDVIVHGTTSGLTDQERDYNVLPLFTAVNGGFRLQCPNNLMPMDFGKTDMDLLTYIRTMPGLFKERGA